MLLRTLDHLFWMTRYLERAENTARLVDIHWQISLMPQWAGQAQNSWHGIFNILNLANDYFTRVGDFDTGKVIDYMVCDQSNPSSLACCLQAARENARAIRGTLSTELWEAYNETWLEFERLKTDDVPQRDPVKLFEWLKLRSNLCRGVMQDTLLQDQAFHVLRLGCFFERADNMARLLDVAFNRPKAHALASIYEPEFDFYYGSVILKAVSCLEIYHKAFRAVIKPQKLAELLILRSDVPRSLAYCINEVCASLRQVTVDQSLETLRFAGRLHADLCFAQMDEILSSGLHAFLSNFLKELNHLGVSINKNYALAISI